MSFSDVTLPMVTCPLCCRPGFSTSDSLCSALVDVTTRKLCCPICNYVVVGLDKFTIHLFSHSVNKSGLESGKESMKICQTDDYNYSDLNIKSNLNNEQVSNVESMSSLTKSSHNLLKLQHSTSVGSGIKLLENQNMGVQNINNNSNEIHKYSNIPENPLICFRAENGQLFAISQDFLSTSLKNVTINTQNYITNTNITTSTVHTNVVEKVQKRKYSQVFEHEISENMSKSCETNSPDNYSNIESVNSWQSTSSVSSEPDKPSANLEREFESCKDLLTKGDFSTLSDDISELDIKKDSSLTDSALGDEVLDESEEKKVSEKKKDGYGCDICTFVFPNKTILAMHKQLIHKKVEVEIENKRKLLICNMCPRTFSLRSSLMIHRKVAHAGGFGNNETSSFSKQPLTKPACHICGKFFKKEIHLAQHMKAHDEKQWQCTICSKTFTTKYFLKKHRRLHTGETPYKCNKCDKAFTFQQSYHKHLLYHNDEKPYCCAQCGRLFKELSTLHNHERIHSGEKPFACETCGKAFRQRVSYLVHRRIHTGVMPYKCTACNKSFRYKISQRTHKCPAQPPGIVIRTSGSLVERLQAAMSKAAENSERNSPVKERDEANKLVVFPDESELKLDSLLDQEIVKSNCTSSEKVSQTGKAVNNPLLVSTDIERVQADKPQIYLLVKGPNEETYYQPLIISQSIGMTQSQKSIGSLSSKTINSTLPQPSEKIATRGNANSNNKKPKNRDINLKRTVEGDRIQPSTKSAIKKVSKAENVKENNSNESVNSFPPRNRIQEENIKRSENKGQIHDTKSFSSDQIVSIEHNLEEISQEKINSDLIVDELLNNFVHNELTDSKVGEPKDVSSESKPDSTSDMIMMDSNDIFSFILSPDLSSPSDRLGRLTLSPNPVPSQNLNIESFDSTEVFHGNPSISGESQQAPIFDAMSDDALKELLFGMTN